MYWETGPTKPSQFETLREPAHGALAIYIGIIIYTRHTYLKVTVSHAITRYEIRRHLNAYSERYSRPYEEKDGNGCDDYFTSSEHNLRGTCRVGGRDG